MNNSKFSESLFGSMSTYLGANIINAAIPFLLLPVLTRVLSPADYGIVAMFNAVTAGLTSLTGLSVHGAVAVHYFNYDRKSFPQFVAVCLMILAMSATATALIVGAGSPWLEKFTGLHIKWLMLAVALSTAQFVINIRLIIWQNTIQAIRYGIFQFVQTTINVGISLYLVIVLSWGAAGRIWGSSFAVFIGGIIALWTLQNNGWLNWRWNQEYAREALNWGVPLIPHVIGGILISVADRFIINYQLGIEMTGIYFVAVQLAMPMVMVGESYNRAFRPWLYLKLSEKKDIDAVVVSYISMIGFFLIGLLYIVFVLFMLPFIVGEKYQGAKCLTQILILGNIFQISYYTVSNYIFFIGKTGYLSVVTITTQTLYVLVAWFAVGSFGTTGMAISLMSMNAIYFVFIWLLSARLNPKPWFEFNELILAAKSSGSVYLKSFHERKR